LGGGLVAGLLALGLLPLAETNSIGFLTEFRLLELSNPAHPLLQKLMLEAPGSYQHSLIIANLVDQAVKNIGGNALLARVGALYHDVGKTRRPQFFVENQFAGENPHDRLSPHLSFLIITSHVRDGLELLRQFKLPRALEPFVLEHHGTTVLSYFYKRALEDSSRLDELNFRYAGPRPRTKETAVLMLADAVESASRSLSEPSQGSIRALIDRLIEQRLHDDQLADSPLNFRDLEVIAGTFERMLTAILHRRISYPSPEEIKGLKHDRSSRRDPAVPAS
jgi:putative nucleotidyltransferase with HDIG domain